MQKKSELKAPEMLFLFDCLCFFPLLFCLFTDLKWMLLSVVLEIQDTVRTH